MSTAVFGAPEFRARSGRTVTARSDGSLSFDHVNGYLGPEQVFDAEEYFQAREDARRGRWRSPLHPDFVVYPADGDSAIVVDERDGMTVWLNRSMARDDDEDLYFVVGSEYFEAHPEPKPWHAAKAGEVWELTIDDGSVHTVFVHEDRTVGGREGVSAGGAYFDIDDADHVKAGRRVWPEDAS